MGKRRQRSREAVKVKSKRRKIRKRETLLLNRSIQSTEESPSTSSIDQETSAAVSEDVAGNIYIILVLIRKSTSLSFWTNCIIFHMSLCCSGFLVYILTQDSRTGNTFLFQLKVFNVSVNKPILLIKILHNSIYQFLFMDFKEYCAMLQQ